MNKSMFHTIGAVAAVAVMLSSCAKNEVISSRRPALDPDAIAFSVSSGFVPVDMPESKSGGQAEEKPAVLLGDSGDTLYLHPSVVPNERGFSAAPETRGVPIEVAGDIDSIFVTAKINDGGSENLDALYIDEEKVTCIGEGGTIWTTSEGQHFWPDEQTTLDFYAYSNLTFSDGSEGSTAPAGNLKMEDGTLSFSYTVPGGTMAGTGTPASTDAAKQQPDILFALASASRSQTTDGDGTVDLNFEHALAGIQFRAKNIAGGTIKSIEIKNVYGQGDCTYSLLDSPAVEGTVTKNGTFEWTTSGDNNKIFIQNMDVLIDDFSDNDGLQHITTGANEEMTFMMIPQSTEGVEVEIVLESTKDGKPYTYTVIGKLSGPDPSSPITWEAGNIYIYDISTDSINWTYVFEVTDNIKFELGQTSKPYTVTSYRYRTQLGNSEANREPVPWTASCVSANETDSKTDSRGPVEPASVVTEFQDKGDGDVSESGEECGLVLKRGTLHTTYDGDEKLQNAAPKGSEDSPYDLSAHDWWGNNISATTANCYIVNAPGTYMLPLVYGNAIKNGTRNTSAYDNPNFKDYQNQEIKNPYIYEAYAPYDACLVWSDGFYMFENVHLDEQKQWLIFSVNREYMQQANPILAVRDAQGKIMWSWHIWVTERDIYDTVHQLQDYETGALNAYGMMQCNLGWVDGKMVYYNSRDLTFKFSQETSGNVREMEVTQEGGEFDYKDVGSTYYQWGRKDPIVALRNWDTYRFEDCRLHETGDPDYVYKYEHKKVSIGESIRNPNVYYTLVDNTNWCTEAVAALWDGSSNGGDSEKQSSVKTIYDPSPRGFKVPFPRAYSIFVNGNSGSGGGTLNGDANDGENHNQYHVYTQKNRDGGEPLPLTATGQRADRDGLEVYTNTPDGPRSSSGGLWAMYGVYYWTCIQNNDRIAYSLCIRNDYGGNTTVYTRGFLGSKTMARPVRPIEDRDR